MFPEVLPSIPTIIITKLVCVVLINLLVLHMLSLPFIYRYRYVITLMGGRALGFKKRRGEFFTKKIESMEYIVTWVMHFRKL